MEQLDLTTIVQNFKTQYSAKADFPIWFENLFKDIVNKNITIETWNTLVRQVKTLSADDITMYKSMLDTLGFIIATNEVVSNFYDEYLAQTSAEAQQHSAHLLDDSTHSPAIDKKIVAHNTVVGKHAQDHANTLQRAKNYTDALATYVYSEDMNTRIKEQALVAVDNMLEPYNALLLAFNRLKTFVIEKESLVLFDTEGYQIVDTTGISILSTVAIF